MYTRNYFDGGESGMPRGYDGIALRGESNSDAEIVEAAAKAGNDIQADTKQGGLLSGVFGNLHIGLPSLDKIGYEEILIIGIAAFLFFSADGDRECALILLALLLIN